MNIGNEEGKRNQKGRLGKVLTVIVILIVFIGTNCTSFYLGNLSAFKGFAPALSDKSTLKSLQGISDVSKFKKLFEVRDELYKLYDGEINEEDLVEGAIKGMTSALKDPYTVFMNKSEYEDFTEKSEGNYMGIGIQLGEKDGKLTVAAVMEGAPAEKAGMHQGDVILKVNDTPLSGKDIDKAVSLMKGKEKVEIKLLIQRDNDTFELKVTRDIVKLVNVKSEMINDKIGYIQIATFDQNVSKDFNDKLKQLMDQGMKGLILDLRGNPGGYMNECVDVVSNFIEKGKTIVSTVDKYKNESKSESKGGMAIGLPLVILTDGGSASASEIVSGAIRDYKVGTLIGTTTFGKGIVQTIIDAERSSTFEDGTALKVTISKYYTPNGENIHKKGIAPDIVVEYPKDLNGKPYDRARDPQFQKALEVIGEKMK